MIYARAQKAFCAAKWKVPYEKVQFGVWNYLYLLQFQVEFGPDYPVMHR